MPFDPDDHETTLDAYAGMRAQPGLFRLEHAGKAVWLATRYADVVALLQDKDAFTRDVRRLGMSRGADPISRLMHNHMLNQDPPVHTRQRGLINQAFTARAIEAQRGRIEAIGDHLIDGLLDGSATT